MSGRPLVDLIKAGQKGAGGISWRAQWEEYAMTFLGGTKDPSKHEDHPLQHFIDVHAAEFQVQPWFAEWQSVNPGAIKVKNHFPQGVRPLVDLIKLGQKHSQAWKQAWGEYAHAYLENIKDPVRHDDAPLQHFVEANRPNFQHEPWFQQLAGGGPPGGPPAGQWGAPPPKGAPKGKGDKGKGKGQWGPPAPQPTPAGGAPGQHLVDQVKQMQRADPAFKQAWHTFCETYCDGIKDPARHPQQNLENFLSSHAPAGGAAPTPAPVPTSPRSAPTPAPSLSVQVTGLPAEATLSTVCQWFEQFGLVQNATVALNAGGCAGSASVTFHSPEALSFLEGVDHVIAGASVQVVAGKGGAGASKRPRM